MPIAPFRRIWMNIWAQASASDSAALTEALTTALSPYGEVLVTAKGPYWRTPEMLEFQVSLVPSGTTADCLHALGCAQDPDGLWRDWEQPRDGGVFLHPVVYGVQVGEEEASAPPLFRAGDIVVIRDCADARAEGLAGAEAVVHSAGYDSDQPDPLLRCWYHYVMPEGRDTLEPFDENDLQATGRRVPATGQQPAHLSVSAEGVITESFAP
ncbi:hypothetical protein ACFY0G_39780 [Streptomyces sp. NPDC001552]|uniref:hypothetical protein n=1 Tax=Streptomyces sp. NPDC001552 TaxID=3364587 RepID=UPI00368A5B6D